MKSFHLEILSPERAFYVGESVSLVVPISDGMLGIMANHTPLTAAISDGEITFTTADGEKKICAVVSGMVDVSEHDGSVKVLCESVMAPSEIDEQRELETLRRAKMELKKEQSKKQYKLWQLSFDKALSNLKVKKDYNKNL